MSRPFTSHQINLPAAKLARLLDPVIQAMDAFPALSDDEYELLTSLFAYRKTLRWNASNDGVRRNVSA